MSDMSRRGVLLLALAGLVVLPFFVNDYTRYIFNLMMVYAVVCVGFNIVLGYVGQLAFANAAFFGLGAYTTAILMGRLELPFWLAMIDAGMITALAGLIVSLPAQLLRSYYLAIVTLAFGELLRWSYIQADWLTGGSSGLPVPAASLLGFPIADDLGKYFCFLAIIALVLWTTAGVLRSRFGRALIAVRDNEFAAASLAINPASIRRLAFALSGFIVGIGGSMLAILIGRISPDCFDLSQLLLHFTIVMIGGVGSLLGSVVGAILLSAAPELLRNFPGGEEIVFSLLLIGVLLFAPNGLAGLLVRVAPGLRESYLLERRR